MAHTPAPWHIGEDIYRWWITGPDKKQNVICDLIPRRIETIDYAARQEENYIYTDEDRANAALIASAPRMEQVILDVAAYVRNTSWRIGPLKDLCALADELAKAEGK